MEENSTKEATYITYNSEADLNNEDQNLINSARKACQLSYSPYSNFQVGAAVLLDDGKMLQGANQENSSFPAGLCAERVALFHAGTNYQNQVIRKIAVTAKRANEKKFVPVSPCGSCRQVMLEYETRQHAPIEVIMQISETKWIKTHSSEVLLPFCFNKNSL